MKRDFNACEDFIEMFTSSQISAAALTLFGMKSLDDTPDTSILPESMWMESKKKRKEFLINQCQKVYDTFISLSNESSSSAYVHNAKDGVSSYAIQLLRIGALYMEFADGIREGDGERVLRCWRYFLPIFRASHSTNYSCEAVRLLYGQAYALSPRLSNQVKWGRFVNVHGLPGRNIPLDLHMEHLNRLAKGAMKNLGPNKTRQKSITRVGRCLGILHPIVEEFDAENCVQSGSSKPKKPSAVPDVSMVVQDLMASQAFTVCAGRSTTFKNPKDLLTIKDKDDLISWIVTQIS